MNGSIHLPQMSGDKLHPFPQTPVEPVTRRNVSHPSRVQSETRIPSTEMLTTEEKQSAKFRRSSFPPIPPSHNPGVKVTSDKSRHSISEVVSRMRVREKTILGEALLQKTSPDSSPTNNKPPTNSFVPEDGSVYRQFQKVPRLFLLDTSPDADTAASRARTRKTGTVVPTLAWHTHREPAYATFEIRGAPVLSRSPSWKQPGSAWGQSEDQSEGEGESEGRPDEAEDVLHSSEQGGNAMVEGDDSEEEEEEEEEFDFDQGEDEVEAERQANRRCKTTSAVYQRACDRLRVQPLPAFLRQCDVTSMDLRDARLGPADVKPVAIALVRDLKVCFLDLSNNPLGPIGVSYIAEMLQENSTLLDVNLSGTNPGREGVKALSETLPYNRTLLYLRLEENNIEHTEAPLLADIIKSVPTLHGLYLGHNRLGYLGGASIASAIEQNRTLLTLDLQWNHIRRDSAVLLVRALAKNTGLRHLNLAWNGLGKEGCVALAHALPQNTSLHELDLTCNRVDLLSLGFLLRGLTRNSRLTSLKIGQNPITTEGAKALIEAISSSPTVAISEIDITGVPVDVEFSQLLSQTQAGRLLHVQHEEAVMLATSDQTREHDGTNLSRYDPVVVFFEYMKLDNLRVIDIFQYMDVRKRDKLSKANIRDGLNALRIPVTEHAIDVIVEKLDLNKDGFVELDEMMKVQRDTARQVKLRQIKAKARHREDHGLINLHKMLRDIIAKRTEENNESRRESHHYQRDSVRGDSLSVRRDSTVPRDGVQHVTTGRRTSVVVGAGGARRKSSVGGLQLTGARYTSTVTSSSSSSSPSSSLVKKQQQQQQQQQHLGRVFGAVEHHLRTIPDE